MTLTPLLASLRTAARALRRRWRTTSLSVGGLALGVGVCLLAGLYVWTQLSYDRYHEGASRIVRIHEEGKAYTYAEPWTYLDDFPGDLDATVLWRPKSALVSNGAAARADDRTAHRTDALIYTTPSVFDVFTYPLARGDAATALGDPSSIVLSHEAAALHFPGDNPLGQTLEVPGDDATPLELTVTGVMEPLPSTLHVRPAYLMSIENLRREDGGFRLWLYLYVRTHGSTTADEVVAWLDAQRDVRMPRRSRALVAQPLTDIYLFSDLPEEIAPTGSLTYVLAFGLVGLLVLLIACINYVNLTTAQVAERMRDIGLRKTFGASRRQVAVHFLAEALLVTGLAVGLGLGLASAAAPGFNRLAPDPVALRWLWSGAGLLLVLGVTALTATLASAYPVTFLSGLRPVQLFRGGAGTPGAQATVRRALVVTQLAIAMALTALTGVVVRQTQYLADKDLGLDREHTLMVNTRLAGDFLSAEARSGRLDVIEERLQQQASVRATGRGGYRPNSDWVFFFGLAAPGAGEAETVEARILWGKEGVTRAMGVPLVRGQRLDEAPEGILINEAAAEALGEAGRVGHPIQVSTPMRDTTSVVAGILKDFHYQSLRSAIPPVFVMGGISRADDYLFVRAAPGQTGAVLRATREAWDEAMPAGTFAYTFMDGEFAEMHRTDRQQRDLLLILAGVALFVACLGLVGLMAYLADRRRAEIGVRKAIGATTASIVGLFTKDVLVWLGGAFVVAVPVAYLGASAWLDQFAYRVAVGAGTFGWAGVVVGGLALLTAGAQAYRAARTDPAAALRDA